MSDDELSTGMLDLSIGSRDDGARTISSLGNSTGGDTSLPLGTPSRKGRDTHNSGGGKKGQLQPPSPAPLGSVKAKQGKGNEAAISGGGGGVKSKGERRDARGGHDKNDDKPLSTSGQGKKGGAVSSSSARKGTTSELEQDNNTGKQLANSKMVHLFSHLPQYSKRSNLSKTVNLTKPELHPAVITLGLLYADGSVRGSNARTAAMLLAFKEVIQSYQLPPDKVLRLDLDKALKPHIQYLIDCRPHSIAMGNAIKWLRGQIHGIRPEMSVNDAKEDITSAIDTYVTERITFAAEMLAKFAIEKISDGDVIMVYGRSYSVELALTMAKQEGRNFRVVIVDSRPLLEGRRLLARLSAVGIPTTYMSLNALSYIMRSISKVFLGAAAMFSNGAVISRAGTAIVAMMAKRFNIPAIFCCETYKFSDKVQLDCICWNEIGDPSELAKDWRDVPNLKLLNIRYDLTLMKYVSLVITEVGMIPPTSVPVLIREQNKDDVNLSFDF